MNIRGFAFLLLLIISMFIFLVYPEKTGAELWVTTSWVQELPQAPFESPYLLSQTIFDEKDLHGFTFDKGLGIIHGDDGVLTWHRQLEESSISPFIMVNYGFEDEVIPYITFNPWEYFPYPKGFYPRVIGKWIIGVNPKTRGLIIGNRENPMFFPREFSWASGISEVKASPENFAVSLADGRIQLFENNEDAVVTLEPEFEWYAQGNIAQRLPVGMEFNKEFLYVVYGIENQRLIRWDLESKLPDKVIELPGKGAPYPVSLFFSPDQRNSLIVFIHRDSTESQIHVLIQEDGEVLKWEAPEVSRPRAIGMLPSSGLSFIYDSGENGRINFFRYITSGQVLFSSQPFVGKIQIHKNALLWVADGYAGRNEYVWVGE